jgi:alcohol dehydrogenase, propanol-preferring
MPAFKLIAPGNARLVDAPVPQPAAGEVLLRVRAAGLCQTDLHICAASDSRTPAGTTLGHEIAGEVAAIGPGVHGVAMGERFAVHPCRACGRCSSCLAGEQNYCRDTASRLSPPPTTGVDVDGGMAQFVAVPAHTLMAIGDLDPGQAAVLADAGLTAYHAVRSCDRHLRPGAIALVIGVGGLGAMAARYLRATTGARIIILDISDEALAASSEVADLALRPDTPDCASSIRDFADGGVEVVLDFVGLDATMALAADVVLRGGAIRIVGLNGGTLPFVARSAGNLLARGVSLACPYSGSFGEFLEVISLAVQGRVVPRVTRFPLAQADEAMSMLRNGEVIGRAVLIP